jgi:hypothetical protein
MLSAVAVGPEPGWAPPQRFFLALMVWRLPISLPYQQRRWMQLLGASKEGETLTACVPAAKGDPMAAK